MNALFNALYFCNKRAEQLWSTPTIWAPQTDNADHYRRTGRVLNLVGLLVEIHMKKRTNSIMKPIANHAL